MALYPKNIIIDTSLKEVITLEGVTTGRYSDRDYGTRYNILRDYIKHNNLWKNNFRMEVVVYWSGLLVDYFDIMACYDICSLLYKPIIKVKDISNAIDFFSKRDYLKKVPLPFKSNGVSCYIDPFQFSIDNDYIYKYNANNSRIEYNFLKFQD